MTYFARWSRKDGHFLRRFWYLSISYILLLVNKVAYWVFPLLLFFFLGVVFTYTATEILKNTEKKTNTYTNFLESNDLEIKCKRVLTKFILCYTLNTFKVFSNFSWLATFICFSYHIQNLQSLLSFLIIWPYHFVVHRRNRMWKFQTVLNTIQWQFIFTLWKKQQIYSLTFNQT